MLPGQGCGSQSSMWLPHTGPGFTNRRNETEEERIKARGFGPVWFKGWEAELTLQEEWKVSSGHRGGRGAASGREL